MRSHAAMKQPIARIACATAALAFFVPVAPCWAQEPDPEIVETKLVSSAFPELPSFGSPLAVDGATVVVGAVIEREFPQGPVPLWNAGAAYVFVRDDVGWTEQARLAASVAQRDERFGISVALDGDTLVVGASGSSDGVQVGIGAAYVFARQGATWSQQARLPYPGPHSRPEFGRSVAIEGDTIVVGAFRDDPTGDVTAEGAAYVYVRDGSQWTLEGVLHDPALNSGARFGLALDVDDDTVLVGAQGADSPAGLRTGAAYVFARAGGGWSWQATLTADDAEFLSSFGAAVALEGGRALIGAPEADTTVQNAGAAYVFNRSATSWHQEAKLTYPAARSYDLFGISVALDGNHALIGRPSGVGSGGPNAAHLFVRVDGSWIEELQLVESDDNPRGDTFGQAVALGLPFAVVGRPSDSVRISANGAAYVFELPGFSAQDLLDELIARVRELRSNGQLRRSAPLLATLYSAKRHLERERSFHVRIRLRGFIALTRIWVRLGRITEANADDLIGRAQAIVDLL